MNVFIHEAINTTKGQKEDLNFSILKNRTPKDVVQHTRCFLTFQQQKKRKIKNRVQNWNYLGKIKLEIGETLISK